VNKFNIIIILALLLCALLYQAVVPVAAVETDRYQLLPAGRQVAALTGVKPSEAAKGIHITWDGLIKTIYNLLCWIISLLESVVVIFIVWVGLKFMWARGDPTASANAAKSLLYLLIGGVVLFSFGIIISTVATNVADYTGNNVLLKVLPYYSCH